MSATLSTGLFLLAALVNLLPTLGVLSAQRLEGLYRIELTDPDLILLLRHRALLFAIVGGLLLGVAFRPAWRDPATAAGMLSMLSWILLLVLGGVANATLVRIAWIDALAAALLALGWMLGKHPS
ncbi:MAG: phosphopantetheine adenylyltransferase [Pseudomonadales bacterium]|jgi:hypothetical protein|nr:phosphopantetheine adenylyltransferase [Pseudomonadales bacterium]